MVTTLIVYFVGGPFDGHVQELHLRPGDSISLTVALPVNSNVF